jgi:hypothetical protein
MPMSGIDGLRRRRERWIGEGAHGDRKHLRFAARLPIHGRPAMGTEVEGDGISAIRLSSVGRGIASHHDVFARKERGDPIGAPCSPLACETVAQRDLSWIARTARGKPPADACGEPVGHYPPFGVALDDSSVRIRQCLSFKSHAVNKCRVGFVVTVILHLSFWEKRSCRSRF